MLINTNRRENGRLARKTQQTHNHIEFYCKYFFGNMVYFGLQDFTFDQLKGTFLYSFNAGDMENLKLWLYLNSSVAFILDQSPLPHPRVCTYCKSPQLPPFLWLFPPLFKSICYIPLISRVRGPYGKLWTEFFPSFYGPSAKRAGHENKEGKNEDP